VSAAGSVRHRLPVPSVVGHVNGLALFIAGSGMVLSALVGALTDGEDIALLGGCGVTVGAIGASAWRLTRVPARLRNVDVFAVVTSTWVAIAIAGAVPYRLSGAARSFDDALFESVSGFTTTGATILRPIEDVSAGLLFWRSLSQWLGGMGVIVLVIAALPAVAAGGMHLLQAESPGPTGERLTPRVRHTALRLWAIYGGFTIVLALAYAIAGMSPYDAVCHSFTTVSTGGFSPHSRSLGHFDSATIEWIAIAAMFVAGGNFTLYYRLVRGRAGPLLHSAEFRVYAALVASASITCYLVAGAGSGPDALRDATFSVVSVVSTTGFVTADFELWTDPGQMVLLLLMPLGAMSGSTAGGVKVVRAMAVASHAWRESLRQLHPRLVKPVRIGREPLDEAVTGKVLGFLVLALTVLGIGFFLITLTGADLVSAAAGSATTFGNVGPGLGAIGPTDDFLELARPARWVGTFSMLLGRLEIYPVLLALAALPRPRAIGRRRRAERLTPR